VKIKILGLSLLFTGIITCSIAGASALNRFELMDGSVIQGEIVSFGQGVYRVNSEALGVVSLPEEKIRAINPVRNSGFLEGNTSQPKELNPGVQKIDRMQNRMLNDPETIRLIEELQKNPSVQNILQDEELMQAIEQGNLSFIGENPKIKALMKDETVGKIIEKNQ